SRARLEEGASGLSGDSPVLFVCSDGLRSALSAGTLSGMGHEAFFIEGGKRAWREAGLPLEAGDRGFEGPVLDVALKPYDIGRGAMQEYLTWEENLGKE
ncbi:MAG: rhodanese-like domain-containing protein, partial [bacterium]